MWKRNTVTINPFPETGENMNNNIVLLYPYFRKASRDERLYRPLGLACLASRMRSIGLPVFITDCTFKTFDHSIREIVERDPAIVGIHISVYQSAVAMRFLQKLKERIPGTLFIAGGPMPTICPERYAGKFDVVIRGEADLVLDRFCRDYLALRKRDNYHQVLEFYTYPGIYTIFRSQIIQYAPIHFLSSSLDTLPVPYRKDMDHQRYQDYWMRREGCKPVTIMASRGSPHTFNTAVNPVFGRIYRKRALERVMREIDVLTRDGYGQFRFIDDCFTYDKEHLQALCDMFAAHEGGVDWTCISRPCDISPWLADTIRRAGCSMIVLNLDSVLDETFGVLNRESSIEEGMKALDILHRAGMKTGLSLTFGSSGETAESVERTLSFILSHPSDEISLHMPCLPPNIVRNRYAELRGSIDDEDLDEETVFHYPDAIDSAWLKSRIAETLEKFYTPAHTEHVYLELASIT